MVNNSPSEALGGRMTRSQVLYGGLDRGSLQPPAESITTLLQFER